MSLGRFPVAVFVVAAGLALAPAAPADREVSGAATRTVIVDDDSYSRSSMRLRKDDRIKFDWGTPENRHNVTSETPPAEFHSRTTSRDSYTYTRKFTRVGTYEIFCTVHPGAMQLTVRVRRGS